MSSPLCSYCGCWISSIVVFASTSKILILVWLELLSFPWNSHFGLISLIGKLIGDNNGILRFVKLDVILFVQKMTLFVKLDKNLSNFPLGLFCNVHIWNASINIVIHVTFDDHYASFVGMLLIFIKSVGCSSTLVTSQAYTNQSLLQVMVISLIQFYHGNIWQNTRDAPSCGNNKL